MTKLDIVLYSFIGVVIVVGIVGIIREIRK